MSNILTMLTPLELQTLGNARNGLMLAQRIAAIAVEQGIRVPALIDALWTTGTVGGSAAAETNVGATLLSRSRVVAGLLRRWGVGAVTRMAQRQAAILAAKAAGGAGAAGGAVMAAKGAAGAAVALKVLAGLLIVGVLVGGAYAAHRVYTTAGERSGGLPPIPGRPPANTGTWVLADAEFRVPQDGSKRVSIYDHAWTYDATNTSTRYERIVRHGRKTISHYIDEGHWSAPPRRIDGSFTMRLAAEFIRPVGTQHDASDVTVRAEGASVEVLQRSHPGRGQAVTSKQAFDVSAVVRVTPKPGKQGRLIVSVHSNGCVVRYVYNPA